mgnify:FL=1
MKYLHWQEEAVERKPGLNVYRLSDKDSFGFTLSLDRLYVRLRYSKRIKKWFWYWIRLEPLAWRMLKENNEHHY